MTENLSLFIFRRDLRIFDNTGLTQAIDKSDYVIPLFIFTPTQIENNSFKSSNAIQFMTESLESLDNQISNIEKTSKLLVMYGDEIKVLIKIYKRLKFKTIYVNEDYTPYSIKRDSKIKVFCKENEIDFYQLCDILLLDTIDIKTNTDTRYRIFTQFYNKTKNEKIRHPKIIKQFNFYKTPAYYAKYNISNMIKHLLKKKYYTLNDNIALHGGRENGLKILSKLKRLKNYANTRNCLTSTNTMLSAHNKFGTVSVREVYYKFKTVSNELCKQLYWRDFYYYVGYYNKDFYKDRHITKATHYLIKWSNNKKNLKLWQEGKTGYPIVDAAMRQINITGFMHNRGRLITASFLSKDLLIDWKYGEQYFAEKLVDYDRAQNTGNWNWSSSFGMDATSFLRILNPWTQSIEYDPDAKYIKKWLPELSDIPANHLHNWHKYHDKYDVDYPKPISDHSKSRLLFKEFYAKNFKQKQK